MGELDDDMPVFHPVNLPLVHVALSEAERRRLLGRYGKDAPAAGGCREAGRIGPGSGRCHVVDERVIHLDDLLLRHTRLGLLLRQGGAEIMERIGKIAWEELGWDKKRWHAE